MGCYIQVGRRGKHDHLRSSQSKVAFEGSWLCITHIGEVSPGFRMLVSQEGELELSDCIGAIEQMRGDLQKFEKKGVKDFDPITADTEGKWGKKWRKRSQGQFLNMGLRDPNRPDPTKWDFTESEVKTIIREIVETVDWSIRRFGRDNTVLVIN